MQTTNRSFIAPKGTIWMQICIIIKISISLMEMVTTWTSCQTNLHSKKCHPLQMLLMMNKIINSILSPESHRLRRNTANLAAYTTQTTSIPEKYKLTPCKTSQRVSIPLMALATVRIITWTKEWSHSFMLPTVRIPWSETMNPRELSLALGKQASMPWPATPAWALEITAKPHNLGPIRQTLDLSNPNK